MELTEIAPDVFRLSLYVRELNSSRGQNHRPLEEFVECFRSH